LISCLFNRGILLKLKRYMVLFQIKIHIWETKSVKSFMTILLESQDQKKLQKSLECWLSFHLIRFNSI
jgi:hypothetical protein